MEPQGTPGCKKKISNRYAKRDRLTVRRNGDVTPSIRSCRAYAHSTAVPISGQTSRPFVHRKLSSTRKVNVMASPWCFRSAESRWTRRGDTTRRTRGRENSPSTKKKKGKKSKINETSAPPQSNTAVRTVPLLPSSGSCRLPSLQKPQCVSPSLYLRTVREPELETTTLPWFRAKWQKHNVRSDNSGTTPPF